MAVSALALLVALLLDHFLGEPPAWAHPVVAMGRYLGALGPRLVTRHPVAAFVGGAVAWLLGATMVGALAMMADHALRAWPGPVAVLALGVLLKPLLAWRMLDAEVAAVEAALAESLDAGRARLQRLVSRDVSRLDSTQVRESAIESLAENLNDSLVAPLFWFTLGGLPAAALYRFANTADAMWGYRGRYEWAGKWAARVDDALSWLPARLTGVLLCLAARRRPSWRAMHQEASRTPSPNGGWTMGAMALLLGVHLRKPGAYALNAGGRPPEAAQTRQALDWARRAVFWAAGICMTALFVASVLPWGKGA